MKSFKVLWFEDKIQNFDKIIPKIESHVKENRHSIIFKHCDHYPDDFDVILFEGEYSVIFIDLNLKNGQKGIQIIETLRKRGAFIDVLLYSNNAAELISVDSGAC